MQIKKMNEIGGAILNCFGHFNRNHSSRCFGHKIIIFSTFQIINIWTDTVEKGVHHLATGEEAGQEAEIAITQGTGPETDTIDILQETNVHDHCHRQLEREMKHWNSTMPVWLK